MAARKAQRNFPMFPSKQAELYTALAAPVIEAPMDKGEASQCTTTGWGSKIMKNLKNRVQTRYEVDLHEMQLQ